MSDRKTNLDAQIDLRDQNAVSEWIADAMDELAQLRAERDRLREAMVTILAEGGRITISSHMNAAPTTPALANDAQRGGRLNAHHVKPFVRALNNELRWFKAIRAGSWKDDQWECGFVSGITHSKEIVQRLVDVMKGIP